MNNENINRKQTIFRWCIIGGLALVLAAMIAFFVWGAFPENDVHADTTPTEVVTESVTEPVETIPEETAPAATEAVTEPTKKPAATKPKNKVKSDTTKTNRKAAENIFNYLTDKLGYSDAAACGIVANIAYETGWKFNPTAGNPKQCYGLIQWQSGRLKNLKSWCERNGKDYTTMEGQMDFMDWELKNTNTYGTYECLTECKNNSDGAYKAGWYFSYWYERPNNKKSASKGRGNEARKYFAVFVEGSD